MEYSDGQLKDGAVRSDAGSVSADTERAIMPKIEPVPENERQKSIDPEPVPDEPTNGSFAGELAAVMFKTLFIALSLVAILSCILAVAFPLKTMRIFNSLGMSERAVDFAERYISRELDRYDAGSTDEIGNFNTLSRTSALTNSDFIEALYVCNNLSEKLMNTYYANGDTARGKYYAERLEKYTRMYLSLNNLSLTSYGTDRRNVLSMPSSALKPSVFSYEHRMRTLNYRARAYLGNTSYLTYNNRSDQMGVMTTLTERAESLRNTTSETVDGRTALIDEFVDFIDQLGEYLDVEFLRIGVPNDVYMREKVVINGSALDVPIVSETYVGNMCANKLDGDEFTLFITDLSEATETSNGFTLLYNQLSCFTRYAQWAVDTLPIDTDYDVLTGQLHRLHWLQKLSLAAQRLWYMELLLYYSSGMLGLNSEAVISEYGTCQSYAQVTYNGRQYQLYEVYNIMLTQYIANS